MLHQPGSHTLASSFFPLSFSACHQAGTPHQPQHHVMADAPETAQRRGRGAQTPHGYSRRRNASGDYPRSGQRSQEPEHRDRTPQMRSKGGLATCTPQQRW
jgi:hypothetical protein